MSILSQTTSRFHQFPQRKFLKSNCCETSSTVWPVFCVAHLGTLEGSKPECSSVLFCPLEAMANSVVDNVPPVVSQRLTR